MVIKLQIRLGYAAISQILFPLTTSSTYTYTNFIKDYNYSKLFNIIEANLNNLIILLTYNAKNNIHFYRLSSNIIPLATKNEVNFDYIERFKPLYQKISKIINENQMRIDMHPSTYCILNSTKKEVVEMTINILEYHYKLLNAMGIKNKLIIIHVGSNTFGKKNSLTRFINNFNNLPNYLKEVIAIENDDKVFTVEDCLYLAKKLSIPVVLDYHHFKCNHDSKDINELLEKVLTTWTKNKPKMHFSSSKNNKEIRSHNSQIDADDFIDFLIKLSKYKRDIDIMIEAKAKDEALFQLIRKLKYKTNYKFLDDTTIEL